jgi:FkbM family methyltransferase
MESCRVDHTGMDEGSIIRLWTDERQMGSGEQAFTSHGTVMFVDAASGELRHGSFETSPSNVALSRQGGTARIRFIGAGSEQNIACLPEYSAIVGSVRMRNTEVTAATSNVFTFVPAAGKEFGLRDGGRYLSAEPDGRITLSRSHFRDWEMFHTRSGASELSGSIVSYRIDGQMVRFFINNRKDWIQYHQCRGDFYERETLDLIKSYCCPDRAFVDIGANVGNHSIFVSKFCSMRNIIVFEPDPIAAKLLRINLALNGCSNVDTGYIGLALGAQEKQFRVFRPVKNNLGGSRMVDDPLGTIRCVPGDEVLLQTPVGTLKIDVEGMEFDVLKGLHSTVERWRPNIFIEVWAESRDLMISWASAHNYNIVTELHGNNYLLLPGETTT